jgi:hypothetical protein
MVIQMQILQACRCGMINKIHIVYKAELAT